MAIDRDGVDPVDYIKGMARAEEKGSRIRTPRLPHRGSPRHAPPQDVADLGQSSGSQVFEDLHKIEEFRARDKKLNANVDFYFASTYHTLGIDVDLFTPVSRSRASAAGLRTIEQLDDNRLIRPRAD